MKNRIRNCLVKISLENLDALIISCPANITYLTGFREAEGYLLVARGVKPVYFTNFLYQYEARKLDIWEVRTGSNIFRSLSETIAKIGLKRIGFEAKHVPFLEYKKIRDDLMCEGVDFIRTTDLVEGLRLIKNAGEISQIKKAAAITCQALEFVREIICDKMSEKELCIELDKFLRLKGDDQTAFPTIVASGENSAFPHHSCGQAKLNQKFVLIDLGARYYGYCADLTRVFFWGKMPLLFKRIYAVVQKAQELSISKIRDGVTAKEVDLAAREYIYRRGFAKYFGHGLGHGIGLSVHEAPFLNSKNEEILKEGMVITVEPAIYLNGKMGIRLEDMVWVRKNKAEILGTRSI